MKGKILVVEDDLYLMEGIRDILELAGYEVITAGSGQKGLDLLYEIDTPPDIIVSDIMMPVMDGYQFLNAVRSEPHWIDIPFIFLTAKGERADENLGKELGADDYVTKPFGPDDLLVAVSAKLRRHRQIRQKHDQQVLNIKKNIMTILYHEFNTPLTYMVAYSDMLKQQPGDLTADMLRQYLSGVDSGATRLRYLVENFILLVELETGEAEESYVLHQRVISDYGDLTRTLLEEYREVLSANGQTLHAEIDPATPPIVGYPEYLQKALRCLLDNAIKFGTEGNQIVLCIDIDESHNYIQFKVSDTGRGIPEHEIDYIFEPFYQINREHYEDQGSGAGLTIVKRIAQLHGGEVLVSSIPGEGSTFTLLFPRQEDLE
ncbi:MAG: hybrid sensor histidine kinase/response regulator [Chloroflexi bacterium]|nr:hybrid sensor histidine kinase/response regulator [Chloroflexota bacterium]